MFMKERSVTFQKAGKEASNVLFTVQDFVRWAASRFNEAGLFFGHGTDDAVDEALQLVLHALHLSHEVPEALFRGRLTESEKQAVIDLVLSRISERKPAAYLTHEAWFAGLCFFVDERVLIPRSPLAEVIERGFEPWADARHISRVLDVGTGSGCIAIACAHYLPEAQVTAVDVSEEALQVAHINVERYDLAQRVRLLRSDLFAALKGERFDIIISNPPYVSEAEMQQLSAEYHHEPRLGLAAGSEGLDVVIPILRDAVHYLESNGILIAEVGNRQKALVERYPTVPFTWLDFERGGHGVFLLTHDQLRQFQHLFDWV